MPIRTFRGLVEANTQERISLKTKNGSTGYRILKYRIFPNTPGSTYYENVMKIYKIDKAAYYAMDAVVDFSDDTLLAVGYNEGDANNINTDGIILHFDREIINQDIYIQNQDVTGQAKACNFYLELELIRLDITENTSATLKNIRNVRPFLAP